MTLNFSGATVLVTGAGGFIGSHLTEVLIRRGAKVRALVRYQSQARAGFLDGLQADGATIVRGDLTDLDSVSLAMEGCDAVMHLGALISVPYSYEQPIHTFAVNAGGTLNVLQAARSLQLPRVLLMSTSETYGTARFAPITEDHPLQAQSPYSASKIAAEKAAESYYKSFGTPVVTVRTFNTFGPRQSARAVIPTIITQALRGNTIQLGAVSPTRDFNYVGDIVRGLIMAAECDSAVGEVVNLGTGIETSVGAIVDMVIKLVGKPIQVVTDEKRLRPQKSEVHRLIADSQKARSLFGWAPETSVEQGLALTIDAIRATLGTYREGYQV
jgi:dTDP-glucose 4,6-dehydratase